MQNQAGETASAGGKPTQLEAVWQIMCDRDWHTLAEIAERASCPQASASARLRDLRKTQFGGRSIEREYAERGQFRYRVVDMPAVASGERA
jgi:hypothetical protein